MIYLMPEWSFLTNHARVLVCIAHDPGVRLRDIATTLGITERTAYGIVMDLTAAGYVVKDKNGRRKWWTEKGNIRRIWDEKSLDAATGYVQNQ